MSDIQPVPAGFHTVTPSLIVKGAAKAIEFYEKALGAEHVASMPTPDGSKIAHAEIKVGDSVLFVADEFPEMGAVSPTTLNGSTVSFYLYVDNCDEWFNRAVTAGASVAMPLADTFWGDRYGAVIDPYGHKWGFATHISEPTAEEVNDAAKKFFTGASE